MTQLPLFFLNLVDVYSGSVLVESNIGVRSSLELHHGHGRRVFPFWEMKNFTPVDGFGWGVSSRLASEVVLGEVKEDLGLKPSGGLSLEIGSASVGSYGGGLCPGMECAVPRKALPLPLANSRSISEEFRETMAADISLGAQLYAHVN